MFLKKGLLFFAVLVLLICVGQASAGPNANAVLSLDLIADGGAGNQRDDGVTSGTVSGQGTKIAVEVFATGVTTSLIGFSVYFDFDKSVLQFSKAENSAFLYIIPEATVANLAGDAPVTLPASGFLARAEFTTVADVTGREFSIGIRRVIFAESPTSIDEITTTPVIKFNAAPSPDFDGDGEVGIPDFLMFVDVFGASQGDGTYDAKYDLDGNGVIGIPDFLTFVDNFGKEVPPSGGGGDEQIVDIPDANLRAVIVDSLGKPSGATITQADMLTLTRLGAINMDIRNLTGLEYATNLTFLDLFGNTPSDFSVLSGLTNLTYLGLGDTRISDISGLSSLTNLTILELYYNGISDISHLSDLTNLTELMLGANGISDISGLSSLTNLIFLDLYSNRISDISHLSGLTNLTVLVLYDNSISDLAPLVANTGLGSGDYVYLQNNPLSDTSLNTHIPALQARGVTVEFGSSKPAVQEKERRMPREAMKRFGRVE